MFATDPVPQWNKDMNQIWGRKSSGDIKEDLMQHLAMNAHRSDPIGNTRKEILQTLKSSDDAISNHKQSLEKYMGVEGKDPWSNANYRELEKYHTEELERYELRSNLLKSRYDMLMDNRKHIKAVDAQGSVLLDGKPVTWRVPLKGIEYNVKPGWESRLQMDVPKIVAHYKYEANHAGQDPITYVKDNLIKRESELKSIIDTNNRYIEGVKSGNPEPKNPAYPNIKDPVKAARRIEADLLKHQDELSRTTARLDWLNANKDRFSHVPPPRGQAYSYDVDFADEQFNKMMHWNEPIAQQSEHVQTAIKKILPGLDQSTTTGQQAYHRLSDLKSSELGKRYADKESQKAASEELRQAGVPGHKYYAAGSRNPNKTDKNHNYVVYPGAEEHIQILEKK
jgi:hypothetical protein